MKHLTIRSATFPPHDGGWIPFLRPSLNVLRPAASIWSGSVPTRAIVPSSIVTGLSGQAQNVSSPRSSGRRATRARFRGYNSAGEGRRLEKNIEELSTGPMLILRNVRTKSKIPNCRDAEHFSVHPNQPSEKSSFDLSSQPGSIRKIFGCAARSCHSQYSTQGHKRQIQKKLLTRDKTA
jgi:hypothetical protein